MLPFSCVPLATTCPSTFLLFLLLALLKNQLFLPTTTALRPVPSSQSTRVAQGWSSQGGGHACLWQKSKRRPCTSHPLFWEWWLGPRMTHAPTLSHTQCHRLCTTETSSQMWEMTPVWIPAVPASFLWACSLPCCGTDPPKAICIPDPYAQMFPSERQILVLAPNARMGQRFHLEEGRG